MKTPAEDSFRSRIQLWLMHVRMRPALLVVALVVGFSGQELGRHIKSLESWIIQLGLLTVAIGVEVGFASRAAYRGVLRETNIRVGI